MKRVVGVLLCIVLLAIQGGNFAKADDSFNVAPTYTYETSLWDSTDYSTEYTKVVVTAQKCFSSNTKIGVVYVYPRVFQSNARVDGHILQCVSYRIKAVPQTFVSPGGIKYVGMTQLIDVSLSNVRDDDQMLEKCISPSISVDDTVGTSNYQTSISKGWTAGGNVGWSKKDGWSFGGNGSYSKTSNITSSASYKTSALSVRSIDYNESTHTAEWHFDYLSTKSNQTINSYLTSTTWQTASLAWQGPKNANYYFSNFTISVHAEYGLAKYSNNNRVSAPDGKYEFGTADKTTQSLKMYNSNTVYATK